MLALSGLLVAAAIKYLPGTGGHSPADGFQNTGPLPPIELPGVILAAFATLSLGVVLGPEAPLIAIGSGLGVLAVHLIKKDAPPMAALVVGVAGSFAAISTLLGSPIVGAFLLMEVAGLGGAMLGVVLVPGLIAAGVGSLIFVGLDSWTGFGDFSLAVPQVPPVELADRRRVPLGHRDRHRSRRCSPRGSNGSRSGSDPIVARRSLLFTPVAGVAIGVLVWLFVELTDKPASFVLFSGQDALPPLIEGAAGWSAGALVLLIVCKGTGVRHLAEQLPRRTGVPRAVHRRGRGDRALAPRRPSDDRRRGDGHGGDDDRDARAPADVGADHDALPRRGRGHAHAGRHRRGGDLVRRVGPTRTAGGTGARGGATAPPPPAPA